MLLKSLEFSVPSSRVLAGKSVNINQRISNIDMMKICRSWVWELDIDWTILSGNTFCINHITCTCVFLVSGNGFQTDNSIVEIYRSLNAEDSMLARAICTVSLEWADWTGSREHNGSVLREFGANLTFLEIIVQGIYNLHSFWAIRAGKDEGSNLPWCCRPA